MGELLSEFGDLVFSLVIGYIGAIEFLYVVRHLYHWSFNHEAEEYDNDDERLAHLQDTMRHQLANATDKEAKAGTKLMQDGVPYKDGFRIDPLQEEIDKLKEKLKDKELKDLQRQELEKELSKLQKIAEQTRKDLEKAEAAKRKEEEEQARKLKEAEEKREREQRKREEEQARKEAEENSRKLAEQEKQRELEQRKLEEEQQRKELEENQRKLQEQEKQRELEQRKLEEEQQQKEIEENNRKLAEQEKQRELEQRKLEEEQQQKELEEQQRKLEEREKQQELEQKIKEEEEENERLLLEAEILKEEEQRHLEEEEENERKFLELEHKLEEQLRAAEHEADLTEKEKQLIESIKNREISAEEHNEQKEAELLRRILQAREQLGEESEEEQSLRLIQREQDQEAKQRRIEENALLFLEAEKEMAEIQQQMQEAVEKRVFASNLDSAPQTPISEEPCIKKTLAPLFDQEPAISHRVKTQLAQDFNESHSVSSKPLLFPGVSDEGSSVEPISSQQSSFSTQPSEEITTGTDSQYPPRQERQEPDGEDTTPSQQYSEDYLRSLDGIKQRPLIREDGSGRRRAFKKRRSSNSSNSSRESRTSRDEELKMFTSLEEEEMKNTGDSEFTPIKYTSEPTLKVKGHHRRHKRSPAKDMKSDESLRSSLERLGEESTDPWGELKPEPYKNTEFWKREKALSIDEELEFEKPASSEEIAYDTATNMPSASSFEEATQIQNEQAISALRHQAGKDQKEEDAEDSATLRDDSARSDNKSNTCS